MADTSIHQDVPKVPNQANDSQDVCESHDHTTDVVAASVEETKKDGEVETSTETYGRTDGHEDTTTERQRRMTIAQRNLLAQGNRDIPYPDVGASAFIKVVGIDPTNPNTFYFVYPFNGQLFQAMGRLHGTSPLTDPTEDGSVTKAARQAAHDKMCGKGIFLFARNKGRDGQNRYLLEVYHTNQGWPLGGVDGATDPSINDTLKAEGHLNGFAHPSGGHSHPTTHPPHDSNGRGRGSFGRGRGSFGRGRGFTRGSFGRGRGFSRNSFRGPRGNPEAPRPMIMQAPSSTTPTTPMGKMPDPTVMPTPYMASYMGYPYDPSYAMPPPPRGYPMMSQGDFHGYPGMTPAMTPAMTPPESHP